MFQNRNVMELRFLPPNGAVVSPASIIKTADPTNVNAAVLPAMEEDANADIDVELDAEADVDVEADVDASDKGQAGGASSSCETLEACEGLSQPQQQVTTPPATEAPSKPLPPLPKKSAAVNKQQPVNVNTMPNQLKSF